MNKKELKDIVELYVGRKVKKMDVVPDPHNPVYYALRVKFEDKTLCDYVYFLVESRNGQFDRDSLEEVEFETWPPTSEEKNMFQLENMRVAVGGV